MKRFKLFSAWGFALVAAVWVTTDPVRAQVPCIVPDNGTGTADLPPSGCGYVVPDDVMEIIDGLPPGTTIEIEPELHQFFNVATIAGGTLGGEIVTFDASMTMNMTGTGLLTGFSRLIVLPVTGEIHNAPRTPFDPVQTFAGDLISLQGQIFGDPDFDQLIVTAGSASGLPSPGLTRLTRLPDGSFNVDSFFDVAHEIDFVGALGSILEGLGGTTTATDRFQTGEPASPTVPQPCVVPDSGTGTADLPPSGCGYVIPSDVMVIIDGLPPGATINIEPKLHQFFNVVTTSGGTLGGEIVTFDASMTMNMTGTGFLTGFSRLIVLPVTGEIHNAPRTPFDPVQNFDGDVISLQAQIFGDPDFDQLIVTAGSAFGLPSPGDTTLTRLPDGSFNVDSFFDIAYELDVVGAPGSILEGLVGITPATDRFQTGETAPPAVPQPCVVPDNGTGTADLPPSACGYVVPDDVMVIIDGLPSGTTINITPELHQFFNVVTTPGGTLGGEIVTFDASMTMNMAGTGLLAGFSRLVVLPASGEIHNAPRTPFDPVQIFDGDLVSLQAQIFGDPDFDQLIVTAGLAFGLPSPGATTLTRLPDGSFNVDSFFDVAYEIDFVGAPGSILEGLGGITTATDRFQTGETAPPTVQQPCVVPDNGTGTADLPPSGCGYVVPDDVMVIFNGLPHGASINITPELHQFFNVVTTPGGTLGGEIVTFDASMTMNMTGTGLLAGFSRLLVLPATGEIHNAARIPGDPVQIFDGDLISLQAQIFGDPDFDQLIVTAGSGFGLPSPGATTLTRLPEGSFNVDSFFDVAHEIDFVGALGGILEGLGGITAATDRFQAGDAPPTIVVEKQTLPDGDLTAFLFIGDAGGEIEDGQRLVQHVSPGSYTVTEVAAGDGGGDPWELVSIVCDDANSTGDLASATATFNVEAGEVVTCTFTNAVGGLCAVDTDGDGLLDCLDPDDDNDGVLDVGDPDPLNPNACGLDSDGDTCDDCSVGVDGFGPLADDVPADDGPDADSDGVCDAGDCAPGDPGNTGMLSAVRDLQFTSVDDFQWSPPLLDGGGALVYDVLRSATASDFSAATCLDTNLVALSSSDTTGPLSGVASYYLIRVEAACGGQHLGLRSPSPQRREGVSCP